MKKWIIFPLIALVSFGLTGCFDIVEEFHLNKNGSGKYNVTMDMSSLMSDGMMKGMLKEQLKGEMGEDEGETEDLPMEKDTVIYLKDSPGFDNATAEEQKLIEKIVMHMTMSESKEKMLINISFPFDKVSDIEAITQAMQKIGGGEQLGGIMPGGSGLMPGGESKFLLKKGMLTRTPAPKMEKGEDEDGLEMMKMFLGTASFKTIYHLPGKVKKVSIPNAEVEGSTVTVTNTLLDLLEGKAKIDGDIKFK